ASYSRMKVLRFMWKLFSQGSHITLSFGKPMDVVGNFVNKEGESFDKWGNPIDIKDYFLTDGEVQTNLQRETEYTKILADKIGERFHKDNIVLSSHLVAFATFNILLNENNDLDLFGILRLPCEDYVFEIEQVSEVIEVLKKKLIEMEKREDIKLSKNIHGDTMELIKHGVKNVGNFHPLNPLKFNKEGDLVSEDFNTLYYYHNRLENYNLSKTISKVVART
ncbi:MAG: glycerol-3-phosphate O-acyltransferase, partial [Saprospiraceae bacterium]